MMHGRDWHGENVAGWHLSEKYDGIRTYWDGAQLWTRGGCVVAAPEWFTAALPRGVHLDGELWAGYETLETARQAAQLGRFTRECRFVVHDVPAIAGNWLNRMAAAARFVSDVVLCAEVFDSSTRARVRKAYCTVRRRGGEGLVARDPATYAYLPNRSAAILKIKHDWQVF